MQTVGPRGHVIIEKEIRERLGVKPGWIALQRLVDNHVQVYFLPSPHRRSLKGVLGEYTTVSIAEGEEWDRAREEAWRQMALDEEDFLREDSAM